MGDSSFSYRFISARSCSAASGGNIDKAAFIPCSERSRSASALSLPTAPTCTPKKAPTTVPTRLATAPTTAATLVTSTHLNVAIRVIKKTRAKPVVMIHNPYLSLSRSISSVAAGVVSCTSTKGFILSASFPKGALPTVYYPPNVLWSDWSLGAKFVEFAYSHATNANERKERSDGPTNRRGGAQAARAAGRRMGPRGQAAGRAAVAGRGTGHHRMA